MEKTDKYWKGQNTWGQLVSMVFCRFSNCDSGRDISNGLNSANGNLNHPGICRALSKSAVDYQLSITPWGLPATLARSFHPWRAPQQLAAGATHIPYNTRI